LELEKLNAKFNELIQLQRETHLSNDVKVKLELKNKNLEEDIRLGAKEYEKHKEEYEF
jgi:hypothetical protein